jgi:hypothetical protein
MADPNESNREAFTRHAAEARGSTFGDLVVFLRENKKWWLVPILLSLAAIAGLVALSSTAAAPFIYTLF